MENSCSDRSCHGNWVNYLLALGGESNYVPDSFPAPSKASEVETKVGADLFNSTYVVEGRAITLVDGKHEESIPNFSTKIITAIWGQPSYGDLTGENMNDASIILVQSLGGSGTFYYSAASMEKSDGYLGTNAVFIGDRVAIQTHLIDEQMISS